MLGGLENQAQGCAWEQGPKKHCQGSLTRRPHSACCPQSTSCYCLPCCHQVDIIKSANGIVTHPTSATGDRFWNHSEASQPCCQYLQRNIRHKEAPSPSAHCQFSMLGEAPKIHKYRLAREGMRINPSGLHLLL